MNMIEIFLKLLVVISGFFKPMMPFVIRLSKDYLESRYRRVLYENNNHEELHRLGVLRQKIHPPTEVYLVDIKPESAISMKANICQQYCGDIYYGIGFEKDELNLVKKLLSHGDVFFDVGANIGVYTLIASQLVGDNGQVHSFEPLPDVNDLLNTNVRLNKCNNVTVNPFAVGDRDGTTQIFINAQNALSSLGNTNRGAVLQSQNVRIVTLDSYSSSANLSRIDFLKIDVEGFEGHVLRGAEEILDRSTNLIVMSELAKKNFKPLGFSVKDVIDWMRGKNFEVWMIRSNEKGLQYVPAYSNEYIFQNFIFMRRSNKKYGLLESLT